VGVFFLNTVYINVLMLGL